MQVKYTIAFLASGYPFPLTFIECVNKTIICITWNVCSLAQTVFLKNSKRLQEDNGGKNYFTCQKIFFLNGFLLFNRLYVRNTWMNFPFTGCLTYQLHPAIMYNKCKRIKDYNRLSNQLFIFQNFIGFVVFLTIKAPSMPIPIKPI